jgi:hypothetical protein
MKKIIDVSGYGHSGKSAISEYLKDFEDVFAFPTQVEFELFRVPGGLLDLYSSIYLNWNLIRSRARINEFKQLVSRIGIVQSKSNISSYWNASGHGYNKLFNDKFIDISNEFIDKLIVCKQNSFWPYDSLRSSGLKLLADKIYNKLSSRLELKEIYYTDRNEFKKLCSEYIHDLFNEADLCNKSHVVLNNAFEPYNPSRCLDMVENSFSIIVDRDPRDIFASLISSQSIFVPSFEKYKNSEDLKKRMVGFDDVNQFIARFKILKNNVTEDNHPNVLRIRYEDFILCHTETTSKIHNFIGLSNLTLKQNVEFNVEESKRNVGIWRRYKDLPEVIQIQNELSEYCYQI